MKRSAEKFLFLLLSGAAVLSAQGTRVTEGSGKTVPASYYKSIGAAEISRYQDSDFRGERALVEADRKVREATKSYQTGAYEEAIRLYLDAIEIFNKLEKRNPEIKRKVDLCKEAISKAYFYQAEQCYHEACTLADSKKFEEAINCCVEAKAKWPACKERMDQAIRKFKEMQKNIEVRNQASEKSIDPDKETRLYRIDVLQKQGDAYYKDRQFDRARDKYEEILSRDPYNFRAIESIRRVNMKFYEIGVRRTNTTRREMAAEADWKMISPGVARLLAPSTGKLASTNEPIVKAQKESPVAKKLRAIQLDSVQYEDVPLVSVFKNLMERSKDLDPEKTGVNIILLETSKDSPQADAQAGRADAGGGEGGGGNAAPAAAQQDAGGAAAGGSQAPITMSTENVTLLEAIQYICKSAKLQYKIDDYALVIAPEKYPLANLERKIYIIEGNAFAGKSGDVRDYFKNVGVKFQNGASATYLPSSGRLIVNNTREELEKVDLRIKEMNTQQPQILVEAKFVEVQLNDAEELGFHYSVSRSNSNVAELGAGDMDGTLTAAGVASANMNVYNRTANDNGYYSLVETIKAGEKYSASGNYYTVAPIQEHAVQWGAGQQASLNRTMAGSSGMTGYTDRMDGLFGYQHYNKYGYKVAATVTALDQSDSRDVLSCPRITTVSGYTAIIKMVTKQYFPEDWEEPQMSNDKDNKLFIPSTPNFGDPEELGISLKVTPRNMGGGRIEIPLNPVLRDFKSWDDYSYPVQEENTIDPNQPIEYTVELKMPIIEEKSVTTLVRCDDGETIIVGGIVEDKVNAYDDQYPILGTLPLVGRFFQSKAKGSKKKNLLIFLTCRLINPDGSPSRERYVRGLPPFRQ